MLLKSWPVIGAVALKSAQVERPGALMVIAEPMEILLNEVSPQVTPLSLAEVCAVRDYFRFPF